MENEVRTRHCTARPAHRMWKSSNEIKKKNNSHKFVITRLFIEEIGARIQRTRIYVSSRCSSCDSSAEAHYEYYFLAHIVLLIFHRVGICWYFSILICSLFFDFSVRFESLSLIFRKWNWCRSRGCASSPFTHITGVSPRHTIHFHDFFFFLINYVFVWLCARRAYSMSGETMVSMQCAHFMAIL